MSAWGFVLLAYGIVWAVLLLYLFTLKKRLRKLEEELLRLRSSKN